MEQYETITIQDDPVIRALNGDASSPVYGGSLREGLRVNEPDDYAMYESRDSSSPLLFFIVSTAFLAVAILFW